jgi:outer membrane protein OmpA-like peptidoglycan-associated protein
MISFFSRTLLPCLAVALSLAATAATAQSIDGDVDVNLDALGLRGSQPEQPRLILRYPGSDTATREVPTLRYPDVPEPSPRPAPRATAKPRPEPDTNKASAKPAPAKPATQPKAAATTPAAPKPEATPAVNQATATPDASSAPEPAPVPAQAQAKAPVETEAPPTESAALAAPEAPQPAPAAAPPLPQPDPAIARILFDPGSVAILGEARSELESIGQSLRYDRRRIELRAYAGEPGDKASDARRQSLRRGLAVHGYLIDLGIDKSRIDVRALGGVTDTGPADRVDVTFSGS